MVLLQNMKINEQALITAHDLIYNYIDRMGFNVPLTCTGAIIPTSLVLLS